MADEIIKETPMAAITISKPVTVDYPEIPWNSVLVNLAISQRIQPDQKIEGSVNATFTPYRVLPDGTIDPRYDKVITASFGSMAEDAKTNPALSKLTTSIMNALQAYITDMGI